MIRRLVAHRAITATAAIVVGVAFAMAGMIACSLGADGLGGALTVGAVGSLLAIAVLARRDAPAERTDAAPVVPSTGPHTAEPQAPYDTVDGSFTITDGLVLTPANGRLRSTRRMGRLHSRAWLQ